MGKKTVADIEVRGKRVLTRVDYNVPIENGKITDDRRVTLTLDQTGETDAIDLDAIPPRSGRWIDYVAATYRAPLFECLCLMLPPGFAGRLEHAQRDGVWSPPRFRAAPSSRIRRCTSALERSCRCSSPSESPCSASASTRR